MKKLIQNKLRGIIIPKTELRSFTLTLIATLMGVLIALILTNLESRKKEKNDTIKLLKTAKFLLIDTKVYSQKLEKAIKEFQSDTLQDNNNIIEEIKKTNPIPFPTILETVLTNEVIFKNISEYSQSQIYKGLINLKKLANYQTLNMYDQSLSHLADLIELEIQFQKNELGINELQSNIKIKSEQWLNNNLDIRVINTKN